MKPGTREHGPASLKLSYSTAIPAHMRSGILEITNVHTIESERGKGHASLLLQRVCAEADECGEVLILMPDADNLKALAEWYRRFGFEAIQAKPVVLMARRPGSVAMKVKPLVFSMNAAMGMH